MKPICVQCSRFYRIKKTGVSFIEGMPNGNDAEPGNDEPERWRPYKLWHGDLYECPDCGARTISGVGQAPISEHYMPDFDKLCDRFEPMMQVNDC